MKKKNNWTCLLLILAGIVLGGFIGSLFDSTWLNFGQTFGLSSPMVLDLGIICITFALTIKITIASIIGIVIGILIYRFL
ncbi:MAG: DUF4321 domain-containing protein [Lachnospiraceae bacterium]|nr:DUF4321 domain-containing protein [Lachnospiraceae bacterium]